MKRANAMAASLIATSALLAACSSVATPTESSTLPSSESGSASPSAPPAEPAVERKSTTDADRLRLSVTRFEEATQKSGGAKFVITSATGKKGDVITISPNGDEKREWLGENDEPAATISIVGDGVYTSKTGLDVTGVNLMDAVAPDAEWMLEPYQAASFVPLSPARVVESILAYSSALNCEKQKDDFQCTISATGMNSVPGLGTFESPEDGLQAIITLDAKDNIKEIILFPDTEEYNLTIDAIEFLKADITAPKGETVKYADLVAEQQKREAEASPAAE